MNQKQWNDYLTDLRDLNKKHGLSNRSLKVAGQKNTEDKIQKVKEQPWEFYDSNTYGSPAIFNEFTQTKNLKLVWARMSSQVREYELSPDDIAIIAPDYCPVTGALIDYGYGYNRVTDNPYFRPGIDHKKAVSNGGDKLGAIDNIQIISDHSNRIKNNGSIIDFVKLTNFELDNLSL